MKNARILVVDDEEDVRVILEAELSPEGFYVQMAADGEEAIDFLKREAFDLVILDIKMPKVDGFGVLRFIQNSKEELINPKIKVIMLTGFGDLKNCCESKKLGARDMITKPYDLVDLLATIDRVLSEKEKVPAV
ncbi:MAG: response regulator [Candidatus Paceibacterota bacterium]|jgi:DNA-binding response OmpR family regulator